MMPKRFDSGVFGPERAALMKAAFDAAWVKVVATSEDSPALSNHLAGAIVEMVNAGITDSAVLISKALVALASAKGISGEWMIKREAG
jgi:hypothetical protein